MRSDVERWNTKYDKREPGNAIEPDPLLTRHRERFEGGLCIDIAGGVGDNGLFLEQRGYRSIIVDASESGLRLCRHKARANGLEPMLVVADLDRFVLPAAAFDAVLVFRYLNRNLIDAIRRCVKPGGLLCFKTFNPRHLARHPGFPEQYVLRDGELSKWFQQWHCVESNDGTNPDTTWFWLGFAPVTPA